MTTRTLISGWAHGAAGRLAGFIGRCADGMTAACRCTGARAVIEGVASVRPGGGLCHWLRVFAGLLAISRTAGEGSREMNEWSAGYVLACLYPVYV